MSVPDLFAEGSTLRLRVADQEADLDARITGVYTFTMSSVLAITLPDGPGQHVLKLFDRRHATDLRKDEGADPWTEELEHRYHQYVLENPSHALEQLERWKTARWNDSHYQDPDCGDWGDEEIELWIQFMCWHTFRTEQHAYGLLQDLQGVRVPKLHGECTWRWNESPHREPVLSACFDCPGLVLQHITGFPLTDIKLNVPQAYWQGLCDQAIDIVLKAGERGVHNTDVSASRSFIVHGELPHLQVFMIDFGLCSFRDQAPDLETFRSWQAWGDEEGRVGRIMERHLNGGYTYVRSETRMRLVEDFLRVSLKPEGYSPKE